MLYIALKRHQAPLWCLNYVFLLFVPVSSGEGCSPICDVGCTVGGIPRGQQVAC